MPNELVPSRRTLPLDQVDKSGTSSKVARSMFATAELAKGGIEMLSLLHRNASERVARTLEEAEVIRQGYGCDRAEDKPIFDLLKNQYVRNAGRIAMKAGNDISRLIEELPPYIDTRSRGQRARDDFAEGFWDALV